MNYTVIARRWRPKRLEDVIGQSHIVTTVKNAIKFGRIPHAYLFTGPRGVGKTSLARIIAKAVNCIDGPKEEPCGICENCVAIDNGSFVDVVEIDAASTRGIDDIRELTETVRYMPMKGRYKLYILDEAHMLTPQARDAFLKTLEEPPGNNIFILATTEPQKIPHTIMSRCQRFDFRRISEKDIIDQMKRICEAEGIGYDENAFRYISAEADGSMRDAESILDQIIAYSGKHILEKDVISVIGVVEKESLLEMVKSIVDGNMKLGLETIERVLDKGHDARHLYEGLVSFLRNLMVLKVYDAIPPFMYMGEEEYRMTAGVLKGLEYYEIQNMLNYLLKAEDLMKGFFPKVSLEVIYINLYNLSKLRDVGKVIDRLYGYGQHEHKEGPVHPEMLEQSEPDPGQAEAETGVRGFIEYLRKKKPFISSIFENLDLSIDGDSMVVSVDKNYAFIKDDMNLKDEIRQHLKAFFGADLSLVFRDSGERKKNLLEEYVKEAETLFKT